MGSVMRFGKSNTDHFFFLHTAFRSQQGNLMLPDNAFKAGVKYTLAFWVKGSKAMQMLVGIMEPAGEKPVAPYKPFNITTSWQRIVYTFTATDKSQSDTRLYIRGEQSVTFSWLMFTKFVLVEGNKAPEWTDSSREFKAQMEANEQVLTAMRNNYTQIDGGLILSTILKLGAILRSGVYQESAGVKAMLESVEEVAAYFGGTLAEAIAGTKQGMCVIKHNGSFKASNAEIEGKVTAKSGNIGGFSVTDNTIAMQGTNGMSLNSDTGEVTMAGGLFQIKINKSIVLGGISIEPNGDTTLGGQLMANRGLGIKFEQLNGGYYYGGVLNSWAGFVRVCWTITSGINGDLTMPAAHFLCDGRIIYIQNDAADGKWFRIMPNGGQKIWYNGTLTDYSNPPILNLRKTAMLVWCESQKIWFMNIIN
jgi:hypothetical protein